MKIKFDKDGNFLGVQVGDELICPDERNKQIQSNWDNKNSKFKGFDGIDFNGAGAID